jgi:hypothetical protein
LYWHSGYQYHYYGRGRVAMDSASGGLTHAKKMRNGTM